MLRNQITHPSVATATTHRGETLAELLSLPGFSHTYSITQHQVHRADCTVIDSTTRLTAPPESDALITTLRQVTLVIRHADCLPILIFHPRGLIGAVHAGRKGTEIQVVKKTLKMIKSQFGIVDGLQVWFGPALCKECHSYANYTKKYDLIEENQKQLRSVFGQNQIQLLIDPQCTKHSAQTFYSYRAEGIGVPMNVSAITLL